ncbi:MAG: flagella basal body P-ring formation protein FlgA [Parasphingorhabdus sp.]|uniref:flagella basal body P-ring formation protein FlgA n=1 Tax=Parasphingorhabdus sp. TaxID=2709688 RepID=UPI003002909D
MKPALVTSTKSAQENIMLYHRVALPILFIFSMGAASPFEDTAQLDRQVAMHLSANIGDAGGARAPIDTKLRLTRCPGTLDLSETNNSAVMVSCPALGWRIFVPVQRGQTQSTSQDEFVVLRNQPLTLVVKRPSFSISYGVIAQENGRLGDYISVRSSRKSKEIMARVSGSGEVELTQ